MAGLSTALLSAFVNARIDYAVMCLRCVGYVRSDVTSCTAYGCPLHPYRPFQKGTEEEID